MLTTAQWPLIIKSSLGYIDIKDSSLLSECLFLWKEESMSRNTVFTLS